MSKYSIIFVTVPNIKAAKKITNALLRKRLVACVNIIKGIDSFFWWQGKIDKATECLLVIKTRKKLFPQVRRLVTSLHPYEVPEIISISAQDISLKFSRWLDGSIRESA